MEYGVGTNIHILNIYGCLGAMRDKGGPDEEALLGGLHGWTMGISSPIEGQIKDQRRRSIFYLVWLLETCCYL